MKNLFKSAVVAAMIASTPGYIHADECTADSVEMLAFSSLDGSGGLRLAKKCCKSGEWRLIGDGYTFVSSDFGPWGNYKKMYGPELHQNPNGSWTASWITDMDGGVIGIANSPDLKTWQPQVYRPGEPLRTAQQYLVDGKAVMGTVVKVPQSLVTDLNEYAAHRAALSALYGELMADDPTRFADLAAPKYIIKADAKASKPISDMLIGIFFEDINYGADGGLYAELVQNRDFEYTPSDRGNDRNWNSLTAWSFPAKDKGSYKVVKDDPIHPNNPHYLTVDASAPGFKIVNGGYDGIALTQNDTYELNLRARVPQPIKITASLVAADGSVLAEAPIKLSGDQWKAYECKLRPTASAPDASLTLTLDQAGKADFDIISLFPQNTFNGRKNGLRADLAQTLADLHPRFVRFPGGCVAHGDGIDNIYDWKGSIGPLEARKPLRNLWNYHQTRGLGYHEYFLFCEDIGAEPLPVLAAGVPCQNSGTKAHHSHDALTTRGQQCGIPMEEMDAYIQDILDLIEYANGDTSTTWGAKRAEAGHPEPFNLKYIGIGNEDMITEVFIPRFTMIYNAVKERHPEVEVVGTVGPFYEGADYDAGWKLADELAIPYVDEHYYVQPGWMIYNQDYYDNYKRGATKVYLGEYAAHVPGRHSNMETALAEALYLTSVERNGDVVAMTSYAPLLGKDRHMQWTPDLIYFNNTEVRPTTDYYVQQLYGANSGDVYIPANTTLSTNFDKAAARVGSSIVFDKTTGDYIIKLANLLPTEVNTVIDLKSLKIAKNAKVSCTVMTGAPSDSNVKPVTTDFSLRSAQTFDYQMPPYSFSVIRISKK